MPAPCLGEFRDGSLPGTGCIADTGETRYISPSTGEVHATKNDAAGARVEMNPPQLTPGGELPEEVLRG